MASFEASVPHEPVQPLMGTPPDIPRQVLKVTLGIPAPVSGKLRDLHVHIMHACQV
jgi:hypothetical protein